MKKNDCIILEKYETIEFNMVTKRYVVTNKDNIVVSCGDFIDTDYFEVKYEEKEDEKR